MSKSCRLLIVGGYGMFGGRLASLLADQEHLTLVISGRSLQKALAFCAQLPARARLEAARFDRDGELDKQLEQLRPDMVVDASGPFQGYGTRQYALVKAAINQNIRYFDLADGADFVQGINQFDRLARERGVSVLSGASSFPTLTVAAINHIRHGFGTITAIRAGVAPSPRAALGLSVIRAISSYAGKPVALRRNGHESTAYPLTETMRYTIAAPGALPLPRTLFSLVEVPDLRLLAELYPQVESVWVGAGPRPEILHRILIGLGFLVKWRILPSLVPFARLAHLAHLLPGWGEHRSGMFVEIDGTGQDGRKMTRSWHLNAEGDTGPMIPSMAIARLVRQHLAGHVLEPGARSAAGVLSLADYEAIFANHVMTHGVREEAALRDKPLFQRVLGEAFATLPPAIKALHDPVGQVATMQGRASVTRGRGLFARLIAFLVGFPRQTDDCPVSVRFTIRNGVELWEREFDGQRFHSTLKQGKGRFAHFIEESFGPLTFTIALVVDNGKVGFHIRHWRFLGLPLPRWLAPGGNTYESEADGVFRFHVEISHWLFGLIVCYDGWLKA